MHSLRSAFRLLTSLSKPWAAEAHGSPSLLTEIALSIAAARLTHEASYLGVNLSKPAPAGLAVLWEAAARIQKIDSGLLKAIDKAASTLSPHELGILYEASRNPKTAKKEGLFYTPQWLAMELTKKTLQTTAGAILDPACGGGAFLLAAFELCSQATDPHLAIASLYGVDRDPLAAAVCRAALLCSAGNWTSLSALHQDAKTLTNQIRYGDSLVEPESLSPQEILSLRDHHLICWQEFTPRGGFDAVIGNPPYGLSRGEQITEAEKTLLRRLYHDWTSGKLNKYLLFMARGYQLLRPGGRLGFVVPNSWLAISNATALRRKLVHDGGLIEICDFSELLFETAGVEVVTVIAQKEARRPSITITHNSSNPMVTPHSFEFPAPSLSSDCSIPLRWNSHSETVMAKILQHSIALGDAASPVVPRIALQAYATGKGSPPQTSEVVKARPFDRDSRDGPDVYPYYQGSDIDRYQLRWSGGFLKHGPFLAEPQELSRFAGPRIVAREILGTAPHLIRAAFLEETALYNKSVLHITAKPSTSRDTILAILGILNSRLASFVVKLRGKKSQRRLFPKILNADLKGFPIPCSLERDCAPLAKLVQLRLSASPSELASLDSQIEKEVLTLYSLDTNATAALSPASY